MSQTTTVPFSTLFRSPLNMRQGKYSPDSIQQLAALIKAQGLINPVAILPEIDPSGSPTGRNGVIAGGRRLAAISLLVKEGEDGWTADSQIEVKLYDQSRARAVSLSENSGREEPTACDEFEAFRALIGEGKLSVEAIAAQYGVKLLYVKQRLKLAAVAPEFIAMCREGELDLEELEALTLTDDQEEQRRVIKVLGHSRSAYRIREALTTNEVALTNKKAKFIGVKAYEKAGGQVRRDMFDESHGTLQDSGLLERLVIEKLQKAAAKETADGANWVQIEADGCNVYSQYPEVRQISVPTPEQTAQLASLQAERAQLDRESSKAGVSDDRLEEIDARLDAIGEEEQAIEDASMHDDPNQTEIAGTVVTINHQGKLEIHRNRVRAADMRRIEASRKGNDAGVEAEVVDADHSDALIRRLTAHRTAALQVELAGRSDVALVALTAAMLASKFRVPEWVADDERQQLDLTGTGVAVSLQEPALHRHITDLDQVPAVIAFRARRDQVEATLRAEVKNGDVFGWLINKPHAFVMELMAFCTALAMDSVQLAASTKPAAGAAVAEALGLDMRKYWKATSSDYFKAVSKPVMLRAIQEVTSEADDGSLEALKKAELAKRAEHVVEAAGWNWLPAPLRA